MTMMSIFQSLAISAFFAFHSSMNLQAFLDFLSLGFIIFTAFKDICHRTWLALTAHHTDLHTLSFSHAVALGTIQFITYTEHIEIAIGMLIFLSVLMHAITSLYI